MNHSFVIAIIFGLLRVAYADNPIDTSDMLLTGYTLSGDSISIEMKSHPADKRTVCIGAMNFSKMSIEDRIRVLSYSRLLGKRISMRIDQSAYISRGGVWLVDLISDDISIHSIPDDGFRGSINIEK